MQLYVRHRDAKKAARALCSAHVNSQARETTQVLYTIFFLWMCAITGTIKAVDKDGQACELPPYKQAYQNHPIVRWAAACRAHARWTLAHAKELCLEYTRRHDGAKKHLCEFFVDHIIEHVNVKGWPIAMPETVSPDEWLASLDDNKLRRSFEWRVAAINPPEGCQFGVLALDMIGPRKAEYDDCVGSYNEYYVFKQTFVFSRAMNFGRYAAAEKKRKREAQ